MNNEKIVRRDRYLEMLKRRMWNGAIKVITGVRRCGKSFLLNRLFREYLIEQGVEGDHIIIVQLDDINNKDLRNPYALNERIRLLTADGGKYYIFLDEIQYVNDFESLLNGYANESRFDTYVTGSNSHLLSKDIITEFRGRGDEIRMYPLSFSEFMSVSDKSVTRTFKEYMTYGGMPRLVCMEDESDRMKYLANLFSEIYIRDIVERNRLRNDADLRYVTDILSSSIGTMTNPKKIADTIRSVDNSRISRNTVVSYIEYLTDSFLFEEALRFNFRGRKYVGAASKYYSVDMGLRNARLNFRQMEPTHAMENIIYNELRTRGYYVDVGVMVGTVVIDGKRKSREYEVDFVATLGDRKYYIQSCFTITGSDKEKSEKRPFRMIDDSFKKFLIIGDDVKMNIDDDGIITVSIYDFLLDEDVFVRY